jgi:hypothetical protein
MRTASCLTLIAIGAIFTFAVKAHPSFLDLQVAGVVIMATGVAGLFLPRRGQQGWLRRRTIPAQGAAGPRRGTGQRNPPPPVRHAQPGCLRP